MKVSIIIPTFNRSHTLLRSLNSVLCQIGIDDFEILVVDDGSSDGTRELIKNMSKKVKHIYNEYTHGPAGARNYGIMMSRGEYVAFLDSDDEWTPNHLKDSLYYLESFNLDASYALWYRMKESIWEKYPEDWLNILIQDLNLNVQDEVIFLGNNIAEYTLTKPFWCFHVDTLVARKNILLKCGGFDEQFLTSEDLEFSFRLLLVAQTCLIRSYHAYYYEGDDNLVALRKRDPTKEKTHYLNTIKALKKIEKLMESSYIKNKTKCREQLEHRIKQYEILY